MTSSLSRSAAHPEKQDIAKKIEQIAVQVRAIGLGFLNRFGNRPDVSFAYFSDLGPR
jgi:hypothetical protein